MFQGRRVRIGIGATIAAGAMIAVGVTVPAQAGNGTDTTALRAAVSADGIIDHLEAFQAIAEANDGNRAAGTSGHEASAEYVEAQLQDAGYDPYRQYFSYDKTVVDTAVLAQTAPGMAEYVYNTDYTEMAFSSEGDVTAPVTVVDVNLVGDRASTSGCEDADFAGFPDGNIALIQRGTCTFREKADNALEAGAAGVIIFNQGNVSETEDREALLFGTLDPPIFPLPVVGTTFALGESSPPPPASRCGSHSRRTSRRWRRSTCSRTRADEPTAPLSSADTSTAWWRARASTTTDPAPVPSSRRPFRWPHWGSSRSTGFASRSGAVRRTGSSGRTTTSPS